MDNNVERIKKKLATVSASFQQSDLSTLSADEIKDWLNENNAKLFKIKFIDYSVNDKSITAEEGIQLISEVINDVI